MKEFASLLMASRIVAHIAHLQTKSYAQHKALQKYYEDIVDLTDTLIEQWQGINGIITGYDCQISDVADIISYFKLVLGAIENNRYNWIDAKQSSLHNVVDEIVGLIQSTLYKLINLS